MAFPASPTDNQQATVANVVYQYSSSTNAWTRVLGAIGTFSTTGNITGGNIVTAGFVTAVGNVTGNYILGNGALLTGVITSVANINNGTSNVTVTSSGGNVTVGVGGTGNVAVFTTTGVSVTGNVQAGNVSTTGAVVTPVSVTNTTVSANIIIANGQNGLSVGPMTYANNVQVTLAPGQRWIIL